MKSAGLNPAVELESGFGFEEIGIFRHPQFDALARPDRVGRTACAIGIGGKRIESLATVRGEFQRKIFPVRRSLEGSSENGIGELDAVDEFPGRIFPESGIFRIRFSCEAESSDRIMRQNPFDDFDLHFPAVFEFIIHIFRNGDIAFRLFLIFLPEGQIFGFHLPGHQLEIVVFAPVVEIEADRFAGMEIIRDFSLEFRDGEIGAAQSEADIMIARITACAEGSGDFLQIIQSGFAVMSLFREKFLLGKIVDPVSSIEISLLEGVTIALKTAGGQGARAGEKIHEQTVQRTAFEAAISVEEDHRLLRDFERHIGIRREHCLMRDEIIGRTHRKLEDAIGSLAFGKFIQVQRFCDIGKRTSIGFAFVDEKRRTEGLIFCGKFHIIHIDFSGKIDFFLFARLDLEIQLFPLSCHIEIIHGRKDRIVVDLEHFSWIEFIRKFLFRILDFPVSRTQKMFLIICLGIDDSDDIAGTVPCNPFDRTVEIVKRAGIGIAAEFFRGREISLIADPRGDTQRIDCAPECFVMPPPSAPAETRIAADRDDLRQDCLRTDGFLRKIISRSRFGIVEFPFAVHKDFHAAFRAPLECEMHPFPVIEFKRERAFHNSVFRILEKENRKFLFRDPVEIEDISACLLIFPFEKVETVCGAEKSHRTAVAARCFLRLEPKLRRSVSGRPEPFRGIA